jgi:SAM-dependent methyltransferase
LQFSYIEKWSGTRILDIGCARGDWLNFIKDKWPDAELHGADAFSRGVNNDGIRFYGGHLPDAPLPLSYFDLVTAWAVFEHLHTPKAYFETVAKALRPGGKFVFLVTNSESCYGRYAYKEDVPRHLYHFSERTLSLYASKCGFSLKEVYFDDRLWDGRGLDTFKFSLGRLAGVTWSNFYQRRFNFFQKVVLNAGILLDRLVFSGHWEANRRRSGIIIVVMEKTQPHNSTQQ